ncbi:hypothetical protein [Shimia sp.]|uniref:hypothetical protein n=1 Tax=Shimia sp. TaxID=1954381 RepID=UPI003B8E2CF3
MIAKRPRDLAKHWRLNLFVIANEEEHSHLSIKGALASQEATEIDTIHNQSESVVC